MNYTNELEQDKTLQFLAYEIRNPITAINMAATIIRKQLSENTALSDSANHITLKSKPGRGTSFQVVLNTYASVNEKWK